MTLPRLLAAALLLIPAPLAAQPALRVERVVMLIRHGVRAPIDGEAPAGTRTAAPWPHWPVPAEHLTPHGAQALTLLAAADRAVLLADGLLPSDGCPAAGAIRIHSNTAERTIASGKAFARGLAPGCPLPVEHLSADRADPLFEPLRAGVTRFDAAAAVADIRRYTGGVDALARRHAADIAALDRLLGCGDPQGCSPMLPSRVTPSADGRGIDLTGPIRTTSGTAQVLLLQYAEGLALPGWPPVDAAALQRVGALHAALFDVFTRPPYMAAHQSAALGRALLAALTDAEVPAVTVLVGHDTNVTALAAVLHVPLRAPGYAEGDVAPGGAIWLERVLDPASGRRFVRASYRTQSPDTLRALSPAVDVTPLAIPGCAPDGCDLARFATMLRGRLAPLRAAQ
ncbi:histidine-type phosphatase [Sphingomonas kyungheensis]|uniref:Histidine-type phosphatase n=1 Tax=Sphingomonas kyungheensis TaxID=1069987 RepID=A0ABU8H3I2_9SPHN